MVGVIFSRFRWIVQEAAQAAATLDKIDDKLPEPEEVVQTAQQSPQELGALMKELIALLRAADQKVNLDDVQPGLEAKVDQAQDAVEQGAEQGLEDLGAGAEGGEEGGLFSGDFKDSKLLDGNSENKKSLRYESDEEED